MRRLALALALLFALGHSAFAACSVTALTFKDAAGATQTLCFGGSAGQYVPQYILLDPGGVNALAINGSGQIGVTGTFWQATQPVSGTFWQATQPVSGTFWQATQPVSGTFWQATQPVSGTVTTTPPANASTNVAQVGGSAVVADPCQQVAKNYTPVSITANTQIIAGTSAKQTYICAINLTAPNTNVALVEGTGSVCGTGTAGIAGGTTAATGWIFANATAPGVGLTQGNGAASIMRTATLADNVCLLVSAANQVSGHIVWVQL